MIKIILLIIKWVFIIGLSVLVIFLVGMAILFITHKPSNDRNWELGQEKMARFDFDNGKSGAVRIENVRDFRWQEPVIKRWIEKEINVDDITGLDVGIAHFSPKQSLGHVFLIFNFKNDKPLGISVESRRSKDETFSVGGGFFFHYEILYVVATKEDLLGLRKKNKEPVYLYHINADTDKIQKLFLALARKENQLSERAQFYHPIFNNCSNSIIRALWGISDKKFPLIRGSLFPGYADEMLFDMGLIGDGKTDFFTLKQKALVK